MTASAPERTRDEALDDLRVSLQAMLAAYRRLRSRDSRQPGEVGFVQHRMLAALRHEGGLTASRLAAAAEVSPATTSEAIDALAAAGLVERRRDEHDRRVVHVTLTPRGRRASDAKHARLREALAQRLEGLDVDDLDGAATVIDRLAVFLDEL